MNPASLRPLSGFLAFALVCLTVGQAPGVILFNKDNSANQSDPGSGVPWEAVGRVSNSDGSTVTGSAVYVGSGWVLTAHHVTVDGTHKYVSFDGVTTYEIDTGQIYQVAAGVDMKVMKLTSTPSITPVTLLTTPSETTGNATLIGWGYGRDPSVPLGNQTVAWGNATTGAKRWGINQPYDNLTISYSGYSYTAIRTILGADDGPGGTINPDGAGDDEAAAAMNDSGSGLFQNIGGTWYLIGITTTVSALWTSYFSDDSLVSPADDPGHGNFFARISSYDEEILALIPEPGTSGLAGAGFLLAAARLLRRRKRKSQPAAQRGPRPASF